jgi:hypothetical protein
MRELDRPKTLKDSLTFFFPDALGHTLGALADSLSRKLPAKK